MLNMTPSIETGKNTHTSSPKLTDNYDCQIMSSLSAALSTLDTRNLTTSTDHHQSDDRPGQQNSNYFSSGNRNTGPASSNSSLSSTVASGSFWGSPPPVPSNSVPNSTIGNYLPTASNNQAGHFRRDGSQGERNSRSGPTLNNGPNITKPSKHLHEGNHTFDYFLGENNFLSHNPFTNENKNLNEYHQNENPSTNEGIGIALGTGYSNGTSNDFRNQPWKPNTGIGTFQPNDPMNGGVSPDAAFSTMPFARSHPPSFQERSSHKLPHLKVKMDAVYPSGDDSNINTNVNNPNYHLDELNSQKRQAKWEVQNKNQHTPGNLSGFRNYGFHSEAHNQDSLNNGSNQHLNKLTPPNEFLRQSNLSYGGNQMHMNKGQGPVEKFNPKDFTAVMPSQHDPEQHTNTHYQQGGQSIPRHPHMSRHQKPIPGGYSPSEQQHAIPIENLALPQNLNPQQVFYMAVPMTNGRGQMLQPVQMVNLGNGQSTFVLNTNPSLMDAPNFNGKPMFSGSMKNAEGPHNYDVGYDNSHDKSYRSPNFNSLTQNRNSMSSLSATSNTSSNNNKKKDKRGKGKNSQTNGVKQHGQNLSNLSENNSTGHYRPVQSKSDLELSNEYESQKKIDENQDASFSPGSSDTITALYHSTHRPPLSALLGHVRRLSRDQVGCRLLQQSLDEDGLHAASAILKEGLPFLTEAMTDPFGNYLFQKILEKITAEERYLLVTTVAPRLVNAALNLHGTRSVQKVVEMSALDDAKSNSSKDDEGSVAEIVTRALTPAAARLCIDSHGNHVIQRILQKLPHKHSKFVFDAVARSVGDVARHRHGCCVIQRCLDSPSSPARSNLVKRIVEKSLDLMQDAYGNYVVQYVLDVCGDEEAGAVCESVVGKIGLLAIQKFSSNVMEKCLERSNDRVRELHINELSSPDKIRELMTDPFGNYVVQKALSVATHTQAIRLVEAMRPHLPGMRNTAVGRRIVAKISRRFPRFDPNIAISMNGDSLSGNTNSVNHHIFPLHQNQHQNVNYRNTVPTPVGVMGYMNGGVNTVNVAGSNPGLAMMNGNNVPSQSGRGRNNEHYKQVGNRK